MFTVIWLCDVNNLDSICHTDFWQKALGFFCGTNKGNIFWGVYRIDLSSELLANQWVGVF